MIATAGQDGLVKVWDFETGQLLHSISVGIGDRAQAVAFANGDKHLLAVSSAGPVVIYTLDADEFLDVARSRLVRGFTDTECAEYFPDSECPTLEEMRAG